MLAASPARPGALDGAHVLADSGATPSEESRRAARLQATRRRPPGSLSGSPIAAAGRAHVLDAAVATISIQDVTGPARGWSR